MSTHLQWPVTCKALQLPDPKEQAEVQHGAQWCEAPRLLQLQRADSPQDSERRASGRWQRCRGCHERRSGQQKPASSYMQTTINKAQAHDPQEQLAPGPAHGRHPQS